MKRPVRALLSGLIDYAGLFPPASLTMADAAAEYNRQRLGVHAFALGRFICPASGLDELTEHGRSLMPGTYATSGYREMAGPGMTQPWEVSVVLDTELGEAIGAIDAFNERHAAEEGGLARVTSLELPAARAQDVDDALAGIPEQILPYFEVPLAADPRGIIAALAGQDGVSAKARCGGVRPELIPTAEQIARFIAACTAAGVACKFTAGLHHPFRAEQPLTYERNPPRAIMHGFVNVFVAAALARAVGLDEAEIRAVVLETDPAAFRLSDDSIRVHGHELTLEAMADARSRLALSYGSCSFREPMDDLAAAGWL